MSNHLLEQRDFDFINGVVQSNSSDRFVMKHAQYARIIHEKISGQITLSKLASGDHIQLCELDVSEFNVTDTRNLCIGDSGAARHAFNKRKGPNWYFVDSTCRPCPYQVNSASGHACQVECMGDVIMSVPTRYGSTVEMRLTDCLLIDECPHCLIALGRLLSEGHGITLSTYVVVLASSR